MWRRSLPSLIEGGSRLGLALAFCALAAAPARAEDLAPAAVGEKARTVLADPRFQREMPFSHGSGGKGGSGRSGPGEDGSPDRRGDLMGRPAAPGAPEGGGSGGLSAPVVPDAGSGRLALMVLAVLAAVALALLILQGILGWQERRRPAAPAASARVPSRQEPGERPLSDADRLAAQGLYTEAVHVLLLQVLRQLAVRFRVQLPQSQTSREVLRLLPLKPEPRGALADLVRLVERSLFGGASLGPEDYTRSLGLVRFLNGGGGAA